jgi:hypothetical protein
LFASGVTSNFGIGNNNNDVDFDYNNTNATSNKTSYSTKHLSFNRDVASFSWWKSKTYSYIIGVDDELWVIVEDGVSFLVDLKGVVVDRKSLHDAHKDL